MKTKAERTICFVTDAMRGAGMPDGTYTFGSSRGTKAVVESAPWTVAESAVTSRYTR